MTKAKPTQSTDAPKRQRLTRERIEVEALALIDEEGIDAFSTRNLGKRLGCEAMSIYHYFPSKAHILDALVDRVLGGMPIPDKSLSPAQRLRAFAHSWRAFARPHPRFYQWITLHRGNSETVTRFLDEILDCFYDAGLPPEQATRGFLILGYYMTGALLDETSGYARGPSSLVPLPAEVVERDYPRVALIERVATVEHFDEMFERGFAALLREFGLE